MILTLGKTRASRHTLSSRRLAKSFDPMAKARILAQIGILQVPRKKILYMT